jgi:L-lactate dehydrogenase (cytochrome)
MTIVNIEDLRLAARRRLPRAIFDFIDGAAEDEATRRFNRQDFQRLSLRPRMLVDVSQRDQSTTVFGQRLETPVIVAPTGSISLAWPRGEILAARAAHEQGTIYTLSTHSNWSIEDVAREAPGPLWFQLYVWRNRDLTRSFIERARAAGYQALVLTCDVQVHSHRERDIRNGFTNPPRITRANATDMLKRLDWIQRVLRGPRLTLANLEGEPGAPKLDLLTAGGIANRETDSSVNWKDLDWFRSLWDGPIVLKGILAAEDARLAVEHGIDGILVSNHGGRQLDYAPSSIEMLPEIVDAVQGRAEVLLDSGVRRGSDVVKALALGAKAVLVGRPAVYGLGASGQAGVQQALQILHDEIDRCLALLGCPRVADLNRSFVRQRWPAVPD